MPNFKSLALEVVGSAYRISEALRAAYIAGMRYHDWELEQRHAAARQSWEAERAHLDNLLARIFRDGGQQQTEFATIAEAVEAADKLCAKYIAASDERAESYPTPWAYEQACRVLNEGKARIAELEAERAELLRRIERAEGLLAGYQKTNEEMRAANRKHGDYT